MACSTADCNQVAEQVAVACAEEQEQHRLGFQTGHTAKKTSVSDKVRYL